jgi:predicted Fe-S protein YdhL (DUF1289 family)
MNPQSGLCHGCFRSLQEIANWAMNSPEEQRAIWQQVAKRMSLPNA